MQSSVENTATPMTYLKVFFRRKELVVIPMFVGLVLGVCTGMTLQKKYRSSTVILVEEGKSDNPLFDRLAVSTTVGQRLSTIRESMLGWNSLLKLVKRLDMDREVETARDLENLVLGIRSNIDIKLRGRNIIDLAYMGEDPELTQAVVQNITDIFVERNREIQDEETSDAITFIEEQLKVYRGKVKSGEIAGLKDQLKVLLVDSTDSHPRVRQLREQITAKEKELREQNLDYTETIAAESQKSNPIISEIKNALENIESNSSLGSQEDSEKEYYKFMLINKLDNVMARDANVNNQIYNMLLQRLETAKITQRLQASKEGTKYTVLDPPRIPLHPVKPNKILVALSGLFLGGLLGFGLVFATEFLDKSFLDVEEANEYLGAPLLGAISKINTDTSLKEAREKAGWFYGLTAVVGVVVVVLTKAISNFMQ